MIGILIVTHGEFGKELIKSAELIVGKQENVSSLSLKPGDDIDAFHLSIKKEIDKLNNGNGVIVFTDLFGGTPSNTVLRTMMEKKIQSITGVNLPMLLETLVLRNSDITLESLVSQCIKEGTSGIVDVSKKLLD